VDLIVNGTFWLGATIGSFVAMFLLSGHAPQTIGWRLAFGVGGMLAIGVIFLKLFVPESPRWLMLRGQEDDANRIIGDIEGRSRATARGDCRLRKATSSASGSAIIPHWVTCSGIWRAKTSSGRFSG
jgi:MFS family permease